MLTRRTLVAMFAVPFALLTPRAKAQTEPEADARVISDLELEINGKSCRVRHLVIEALMADLAPEHGWRNRMPTGMFLRLHGVEGMPSIHYGEEARLSLTLRGRRRAWTGRVVGKGDHTLDLWEPSAWLRERAPNA